MQGYAADIEGMMQRFFSWLSEKDRRRYAAIEAAKLGHGGVEYIARVLACDPKTIRQGLQELEEAEDAAAGRIRKKGGAARNALWRSRPSKRTSVSCCRSSPLAIPCAQACCGRTCRCASSHDGCERWALPPVVARSGGYYANSNWAVARRGRKRRWATTLTATPNVQTSHACGTSMREPAMR